MVIIYLHSSVIKTALDSLADSPEIDDFSTQEINNENEMKEDYTIESQGTDSKRTDLTDYKKIFSSMFEFRFFNRKNNFKYVLFHYPLFVIYTLKLKMYVQYFKVTKSAFEL